MNHVAFVFAFVFIGALMGCGGETTPSPRANGEPCTETPQCASGLCYASVCLDPGSDDDGDGLLNEIEVALETRVDLADSDGDGRNDYEETPQPLEPGHSDNDHDGDGVIDALESAYEDGDCDGLGDEVDHPDDAPPADAPAALPCPKDMQSDACTGAQGGAGGSLVGCHCCTDSDLDGVVDLEDCQPGDPTIWDESTCVEVAASQCQTGHCDAYRLTCQRSDPCEASHACEIATCDGLGDGVSPVCTRVDRECALDPCAPESCDPEVGCVGEELPMETLADKLEALHNGCVTDPCSLEHPFPLPGVVGSLCETGCHAMQQCGFETIEACDATCAPSLVENLLGATLYACVEASLTQDPLCADAENVADQCALSATCAPVPGQDVYDLCSDLTACDLEAWEPTYPEVGILATGHPAVCASILEGRRLAGGSSHKRVTCMLDTYVAGTCNLSEVFSTCFDDPCATVDCDDEEPCTVDTCDVLGVCHNTPLPGDDLQTLFSGCWQDHSACQSVCQRLSAVPGAPAGCHPGTGLAETLGDHSECEKSCAEEGWNITRLSGCMATLKCGAPPPACSSFEAVESVTGSCEILCDETLSGLCPWIGYDRSTCVAWCEGTSLPVMAAYQFSTPSAETLPPNLLENAATLCDVAQGAAAYQWLRNALLAAQSPCMELCSGEGSCYGLSSAAVHACNVDCARSMLDEPGVYASMGSCTSDYTACDLSGATGCCEQLSDCEPAAAAGVCERACEQGETYAGISYSVCLESCSASITESSGEFARRYCQASAISPETYTGCAGLDDNVTVPLECFLACDEEDMNAPCNALKGFACPLACTGLMSWKETAGSPLSSASCYMGLIGPSCDPGQVYTELASSICD